MIYIPRVQKKIEHNFRNRNGCIIFSITRKTQTIHTVHRFKWPTNTIIANAHTKSRAFNTEMLMCNA